MSGRTHLAKLVWPLLVLAAGTAGAETIGIRNVNLVDVARAEVLAPRDVVIEEHLIV